MSSAAAETPETAPKRLYLVDGSGYIFRAYHALPKMNRADGTLVNAVRGFCAMVNKLLRERASIERGDSVAVIFDKSGITFRNEIYPDYKAHRPEPPEDLVPQFGLIREATRAFNLPCIEEEGYEADDLIATFARAADDAGIQVEIVSSDKDLMQLVRPGVTIYDPMKDKEIGRDDVHEKFGVDPTLVVDVQALSGDSVDNVPGVPGIGEKGASQIVAEIGPISDLVSGSHDASGLVEELQTRLSGHLEEIRSIAGRDVKINSQNDVADVMANVLGIAGIKKDKKGRPTVNTVTLEELSREGNEFADLILRARTLGKLVSGGIQKIIDNAEFARISLKLVTLKDDVPVQERIADFALTAPDPEALIGFLRAQEFRQLTERIAADFGIEVEAEAPVVEEAPSDVEYELVTDAAALARWIADAYAAGTVAVDTETTSLNAMRARLVGISLSVEPGRAAYVPVGHVAAEPQGGLDLGDGGAPPSDAPDQFDPKVALAALKPLLEDPAVLKVGHNLKYDLVILAQACVAHLGEDLVPAAVDDTMLLSYVLDAGRGGHGMDELAERELGLSTIKISELIGSGKNAITFDRVPLDQACTYAAEDADVTLRLHRAMKRRLVTEHMATVYETIERPLVPIIAAMERAGIQVDRAPLDDLSRDFAARAAELEAQAHTLAGEEFNVGSPKQLGEILFDKMSLSGGKKGKTGAYATGADVLEDLAAQGHDLPRVVLDWRQLTKLKSTYTDALVEQINPGTGRVHTAYGMAIAQTGRLSSNDPNLQNIPVRTEEGRKIRAAFVAPDGHKLLSLDYSQIELRVVAHRAGVAPLIAAFKAGEDIHALTASQVFEVPLEGMAREVRNRAKAINFGIIYGISAFGLARNLGIARGEAKAYIDAYFERYPGIRAYMDESVGFAREHGFVRTLFGRKIHLMGIADKNPAKRSFVERQAINAPIQGTAADIIKRAMVRVPAALDAAGLTGRMLLQVHDELLFEVPDAEVEATIETMRAVMENATLPALQLAVPLDVDAGVGQSWDAAH